MSIRQSTRIFNVIISLGIALVLVAILCYNLARYLKNNTLFVPTRDVVWDATRDPQYDVDELWIDVDGEKIHGWYFRSPIPEGDSRRVFLFLHGNFANISYRQTLVDLIVNVCGYPMLIFDYRGYGRSEGQASLSNIKRDSIAVYQYLLDVYDYDHDEICIWGKSLGGYGASYLASRYPVHSLVLMYTFSSFRSVMDNNRIISGIIEMFMDSESDNIDHIRSCRAQRVCLIHSHDDGFIPYKCSQDLYENIRRDTCRTKFISIEGTHSKPIIHIDKFRELAEHIDMKPRRDISDEELNDWLSRLENIEVLQQAINKILQ